MRHSVDQFHKRWAAHVHWLFWRNPSRLSRALIPRCGDNGSQSSVHPAPQTQKYSTSTLPALHPRRGWGNLPSPSIRAFHHLLISRSRTKDRPQLLFPFALCGDPALETADAEFKVWSSPFATWQPLPDGHYCSSCPSRQFLFPDQSSPGSLEARFRSFKGRRLPGHIGRIAFDWRAQVVRITSSHPSHCGTEPFPGLRSLSPH